MRSILLWLMSLAILAAALQAAGSPLPRTISPPATALPEPSSILLFAGGAVVVGLAIALEARRRRPQGLRSHRNFRDSWPPPGALSVGGAPPWPGVAEVSEVSVFRRIGCIGASVVALAAIAGCENSVPASAQRDAGPAAADVAAAGEPVRCSPGVEEARAYDREHAGAGSAKLEWIPQPHPDLAGFKLYWRSAPGAYPNVRDVGMNSRCTIGSLPPGRYYFSVTAYDKNGRETPYSNEVTKEIE